MPGAGVPADKAMAIAIHSAALMGVEGGAIGILDPLIGGKRRRFAAQRLLNRLFRRNRPGVIKVQLR